MPEAEVWYEVEVEYGLSGTGWHLALLMREEEWREYLVSPEGFQTFVGWDNLQDAFTSNRDESKVEITIASDKILSVRRRRVRDGRFDGGLPDDLTDAMVAMAKQRGEAISQESEHEELVRLRGILSKFPRSKDGAIVTPYEPVFHPKFIGDQSESPSRLWLNPDTREAISGYGSFGRPASECYSTYKLAKEAASHGGA